MDASDNRSVRQIRADELYELVMELCRRLEELERRVSEVEPDGRED